MILEIWEAQTQLAKTEFTVDCTLRIFGIKIPDWLIKHTYTCNGKPLHGLETLRINVTEV